MITQEQFDEIQDLRIYLRLSKLDRTEDCLHYFKVFNHGGDEVYFDLKQNVQVGIYVDTQLSVHWRNVLL